MLEHLAQEERPSFERQTISLRRGYLVSARTRAKPCVFYLKCSPGERLWFWAKSDLAQARGSRPSESSQSDTKACSPKRGSLA